MVIERDMTLVIRDEAQGWNLECTPDELDLAALMATGVLVVRGLVSRHRAESLADDWKALAWDADGRRALDYNPVNSVELPDSFVAFTRTSTFTDLLSPIFGEPIGLFNRRVVAKDASYNGDVFLHQDSCYQRGGLDKVSVFVALSKVSETSGGLDFWLGTHRFGYLGDAGAIDGSCLPNPWPIISPTLAPGDAVIMNSSCWHQSGPNTSGSPRIIADIHYQPGSDASSRELIWSDRWVAQSSIVLSDSTSVFARSRTLTIQDLDAKLKRMEERER